MHEKRRSWSRVSTWQRAVAWRVALASVVSIAALAAPAGAQGRLSGLAFADYFYNLQGSAIPEESNGFRFRRVYFTYDQDLDSTTTARFQLEGNDENVATSGRYAAVLKQVYVVWKDVRPVGAIFAGLSPTPLWTHSEAAWGYRSVEKTILDLRGLGHATDFGVAMQRLPARERPLGWHLMFANGAGNRPENDRGKKFYLSIPARIDHVILEGVADYEGEPGDRDRYTLKVFGGWQGERMGLGIEAFRRVNKNSGPGGADEAPTGMSVFGRRRLWDRLSVFARYDYFDPDAEFEIGGYREQLFLGGVDFTLRPNVHVMPNLWINTYSAKVDADPERDADVVARLTLYCFFP